jgi:hypothetical protein
MLKLEKKTVESEGRWFEYAPGVEIKIRPLTGDILREIRKPAVKTKMEVDQRSRKMIPVETVDDVLLDDLVTDYLIEDFKGIGDSASHALEVNLASKKLILDQIPLKEFIWASAQSLDIEAEQIKNS